MEFAPGAISHWAAVMALDDEAMEQAVASAATAGDGEFRLSKAWLALMRGEARGLQSPAGQALAAAPPSRDRYQVIELAVLRAMVREKPRRSSAPERLPPRMLPKPATERSWGILVP